MRLAQYLFLGMALAVPLAGGAATIDGKSTVICATLEAVNCNKTVNRKHGCVGGVAQALDLPQFLRLDFEKKMVTATRESGNDKSTAIGSVSTGDGHLVLQGVDGGRGWSLVLEQDTGTMTASVVGDEEGMMIFGACTQI